MNLASGQRGRRFKSGHPRLDQADELVLKVGMVLAAQHHVEPSVSKQAALAGSRRH